jgi:hypothetical protein
MKTSIHLIEQIIRAKTALHLKLVAHRNGGKVEIGGGRVDDLLAEVDAGLSSYERMLVRYKNEIAAAVMESAEADAETNRPSLVFSEAQSTRRARVASRSVASRAHFWPISTRLSFMAGS